MILFSKILIPAKCLLMAQMCPLRIEIDKLLIPIVSARGTFVLFKEQITQKGK